ncbi:MAG TPA: hypothetical protein VIP51_01405 [Eoetvoesiella sp.]
MPHTSPRTAAVGSRTPTPSHGEITKYHSVSELLAAQQPYDIVLLSLNSEEACQALKQLRRDLNYHFQLIFCTQYQDTWCDALSDGPLPTSSDELISAWRIWSDRLNQIQKYSFLEQFESRVMAWLWLRLGQQIKAVRNPIHAQHYEYPMLEALAGQERIKPFEWLQSMKSQGWLEENTLVDRLRLCTHCGSARLNYIDLCPECKSIAIAREPSLHCFVCGHVASQGDFTKDDALICPNCLSRLRHIGSDYDRPIENYRCHSCHAFFIDADVQARCLDCEHITLPGQLRVRELHNYNITEIGLLRCRQGFHSDPLTTERFGTLNIVGLDTFRYLLNWSLQQHQRYPDQQFSLLALRFLNLTQALTRLGEQQKHALADRLIEQLQATMRDTDRCTRSNEECLWLLMPHIDSKGLAKVKLRLTKLTELFIASEVSEIELRMASYSASHGLPEQQDSTLLMARLSGDLQ